MIIRRSLWGLLLAVSLVSPCTGAAAGSTPEAPVYQPGDENDPAALRQAVKELVAELGKKEKEIARLRESWDAHDARLVSCNRDLDQETARRKDAQDQADRWRALLDEAQRDQKVRRWLDAFGVQLGADLLDMGDDEPLEALSLSIGVRVWPPPGR